MQIHTGTHTHTHTPFSGLSLARGGVDAHLQNFAFWGRKSRNEFSFFLLCKAFPKPKSRWVCVGKDEGEEGREGIKLYVSVFSCAIRAKCLKGKTNPAADCTAPPTCTRPRAESRRSIRSGLKKRRVHMNQHQGIFPSGPWDCPFE